MPSFELVESRDGYHLIDKETWQPHHGYEGLPTYKYKATAEAALRKALGMGEAEYDPKHKIYQSGGPDHGTPEEWSMWKYSKDGRTVTIKQKFKTFEEAEEYRKKDLAKIMKSAKK